jgi:hypothetical protein
VSFATAGKAITAFAQNLIRVAEDGANLMTHPYSEEDRLKYEQDVSNVWREGTHDVGDEAASNAKEHVTKHLMDGGMSKENVEKLLEQPHWKRVMELGEQARKAIPKVEQAAKFGLLKFVGTISALFAGGVIVAVVAGAPARHEQDAMYESMERRTADLEQMQKIMVSEDDFNTMTSSLFVPSAPAPEPEPMPAAIAAVAEEPAAVDLTTTSGTQTVTSTVGQVYQSAPSQVRHEMEASASAPKIDHGYDHENFNDCAHTDCLSQHKEFTIDAGFASAHIKY